MIDLKRVQNIKFKLAGVFSSCLLILSLGCRKEQDTITETISKPKSESPNKILPLGASRVDGAYPLFESYRYELWKLLVADGTNFDFIGSATDHANRPSFNNVAFDLDHEGHGGWTSGLIDANIDNMLTLAGIPDIVLFSSPGGNDALQGLSYADAITNIKSIIKKIQSHNPNVILIVEELAPGHSDIMEGELLEYFNRMKEDIHEIAQNSTTGSSKVITVDMATGFNDSLLADNIHYNQDGARFIAKRYHGIIQSFLK